MNVKAWIRYGTDEAEQSLGIRVGSPLQIATQWREKVAEVSQLALDVAAGRRLAAGDLPEVSSGVPLAFLTFISDITIIKLAKLIHSGSI